MLAKFNRLLPYSAVTCLLGVLIGCGSTAGSKNPGGGAATQLLYHEAEDGNNGSTTMIAFRVNSDGSLTSLGTALQTSTPTFITTADTSGHHLFGVQGFVAGSTPSIVTFSVQPTTGALQQTAALQVPTGTVFQGFVMNPARTFMFVSLQNGANNGTSVPGSIATYAVDSSGNLTPVNVPGVSVPVAAFSMIVNPAGTFLYAASFNLAGTALSFTQLQIGSNGTLTPVSTLQTNLFSGNNLAITPNGNALYLGLYVAPQVAQLAVNPATGNLTQGPTVTCDCPAGLTIDAAGGIVVNPQGTLLVQATQGESQGAGALEFYRIDPGTGSLTPIPNTFKSVGSAGAPSFTLDSSGNFLYATDIGLTSIQGYAVSSGGTLTPVPGSPFPQAGGGGLIMVNVQP
jgi:6-phosphogluconolactonase (cycloisomerase 2 family)